LKFAKLKIFILAHEIKEKDDPVFNHLTKVEYKKLENNLDFSIRFHFDKNNPFFKNILLEKTFIMQDEETPLKSKGTAIEWKEEKNLTQKLVKRVGPIFSLKENIIFLETKK